MLTILLFLHTVLTLILAAHQHRVPIIDVNGVDTIVGTLREDRTIVNLTPRLRIKPKTGPVCSFELSSDTQREIPFIVEVVDDKEGFGEIRLKDGLHLDCSTPKYKLNIVAIRCTDNAKSESIPLQISVKDVNDHAPEFAQPWYTFDVQEGKLYTEIARLEATDKDCGDPYGLICSYEISNALDAFPFAIDEKGVLRNTQPLNYTKAKSYILIIVAHDCGMRQSKSVLVTVNVREACTGGLQKIPESVDFKSQTKSVKILPEVRVKTCEMSAECEVKSVSSVITLHNSHLLDGCDKEEVVPTHILTRCDANANAISMLPQSDDEETSEKAATSDEKYEFDGKTNALIVAEDKVDKLVPETFTLLFAMKHTKGNRSEHLGKENILCESDENGMNRHHFSVYTRHCKLEMLMRRESNAEAAFRAAEWRWSIAEVCDGKWHSYAILFSNVDQVDLYIDGRKFVATSDNPEILDDWPLHRSKLKKTRLVVGACWHGRNQTMSQYFRGHLSYMLYLPGKVEQPQNLLCATQCREQLKFDAMDQLVPGEEAIFENDSSVLTLKANTPKDLSLLLQKVQYVNSIKSPTPGHRSFEVATSIECTNNKTIQLNTGKGYIFVKNEADPVLSISGVSVVNSDQHLVRTGAPMLADIKITVTQTVDDEEVEKTSETYLDWCKVHLKPSRDIDLEYFSSPASLIASWRIDFEHDKQGLLLKGKEKVKGYREILSKIHYFNIRAESFAKRIYGVQCAMNDGNILSNELLVTMNIEVPKPSETQLEEVIEPLDPQFDPVLGHFGSNRLQNILELDMPRSGAFISQQYDGSQGAVAGGAVAIVIVVCVGFLLVLLVIGVLKMREGPYSERHRNRKNTEGGMEWDDSGMNITVNPLDEVGKNAIGYTNEEESSDDGESYREDEMSEEDDDDDDEQVLPHVQMNARPNATGLEWDDTTLSNVTHTYNV